MKVSTVLTCFTLGSVSVKIVKNHWTPSKAKNFADCVRDRKLSMKNFSARNYSKSRSFARPEASTGLCLRPSISRVIS